MSEDTKRAMTFNLHKGKSSGIRSDGISFKVFFFPPKLETNQRQSSMGQKAYQPNTIRYPFAMQDKMYTAMHHCCLGTPMHHCCLGTPMHHHCLGTPIHHYFLGFLSTSS
jgi:hypothetical protein